VKNYRQQELESSRPSVSADTAIAHCLKTLYSDNEHHTGQEIVKNLTFEELIGALLLARDEIEEMD
jgi:hypothetical protein